MSVPRPAWREARRVERGIADEAFGRMLKVRTPDGLLVKCWNGAQSDRLSRVAESSGFRICLIRTLTDHRAALRDVVGDGCAARPSTGRPDDRARRGRAGIDRGDRSATEPSHLRVATWR